VSAACEKHTTKARYVNDENLHMFGWILEPGEAECVHSVSQEVSDLKDSISVVVIR